MSSNGPADKYLRSANREIDWILSLLDERGAICGDGGQVDGYRKGPRVLAVAGRVVKAQRIPGTAGWRCGTVPRS